MTESDEQDLRCEFEAGDDTFLGIAMNGCWSTARLARLARLMRQACLDSEDTALLHRWAASGFYEVDTNLDHYLPAGCRVDEDLISDVKEHFMLLTAWYFSGERTMGPAELEEELQAILERGPALRQDNARS